MGDEIAINRKAPRDYEILETYEAGIVLKGSEVKSIRAGRAQMNDAFARIENEEMWLYQLDIPPYEHANRFNHESKAVRRLLLHKNEIRKIFALASLKGRTIVALKMYWKTHHVKVLIGIGVGKNQRDKREDLKKADVKREIDKILKSRNKR